MKTIVIYRSQTGFTQRYAQWIAEEVNGACVTVAEAKKLDLSGYDAIVFGGWACAGGISKLDWFQKQLPALKSKKLAVFCVGGSPADSPDIPAAMERNRQALNCAAVELFYCPGGFNYEKMSAPSKLAMKLFIKVNQARKDKTPAEEEAFQMMSRSYDISDKKYIQPIIAYLKS